jgi:Holliday junction resolvasome RuvABC endonuclease subunit
MKRHRARIIRKVLKRPAAGDKPRVCIGIDASLVGHSIAIIDQGGAVEWVNGWTDKPATQKRHPEHLSYFKADEASDDHSRLHRIHFLFEWTKAVINDWREGCDVHVAIEGYAFSGKGVRASDLHELGGRIKQWLMLEGIPFRVYIPTSIKKAWTGAGNADKALMQMACYKLTDLDFTQIAQGGDGLADAVLIGMLLYHELARKDGVKTKAPKSLWDVLTKKTKAEPIPLVKRRLVAGGYKNSPAVMGSVAGPDPLDN